MKKETVKHEKSHSTKAKPDARKAQSYIVRTKNYQEKFTSLDDATTAFDKMKSKAEKQQQPIKASLYARVGNVETEVKGVNIKADHYEE